MPPKKTAKSLLAGRGNSVRALLPKPRLERPEKVYIEGVSAKTRGFSRPGGGKRILHIVQRIEPAPSLADIGRRDEASIHSRFHSSEMLNLLHNALPDIFPRTIEPISVRIQKKYSKSKNGRTRITVRPIMESHEVMGVQQVAEGGGKLRARYAKNLEDAGFVFDRGSSSRSGDVKFIEVGGKTIPLFFEIYAFNIEKLRDFIVRQKGIKLGHALWAKILSVKERCVHDVLEKELNSRNEAIRQRAANALGVIADKATVPALIKSAVNDKSVYVRTESAFALYRIADRRAYAPLKEAINAERNLMVRRIMNDAIARIAETQGLSN